MSMHPIAHAANRPDHPAVIMAGSGETMTYGEMDKAANRYAHLLRARGLQPGDALLIAGKGHETGQAVGDDVLPFDDVEQASVAVRALDGLGA